MNPALLICASPILAAVISAFAPSEQVPRKVAPVLVWLELLVLGVVCRGPLVDASQIMTLTPDLIVDHLGVLFMMLTCFVVASALTHADFYFERERQLSPHTHNAKHVRAFYASSALFLLAMMFVFMCDNIAYLWISIEATTLASTLLVYHNRTKHAIEATWKYVIICSVGIAFALFGTILIFASSEYGASQQGSLSLREMLSRHESLQFPLLRLGYIFCLLGYGTKAGIFPLHSWLPDAHSEAPAPASAMLSGSLLNCALFAIWRLTTLVANNDQASNVHMILPLAMGTLTAVAASLFLVRQTGLKRLWAYSSIENVGLMLVAIGLGSGPLFFLQALNHSIAKVGLFLLSGNIIQMFNSKKLKDIHGLLELTPGSTLLLFVCAFDVTGAPPFGAFVSELLILMRSADLGLWWVTGALVIALALAFVAVFAHVAKLASGTPRKGASSVLPLRAAFVPALLAVCAVVAGVTTLPALLVALQ
jgi:hydrogenase-4 component F